MSTRSTPGGRGLGLIALAAMLWGTVGVATQGIYTISATTPIAIGFFRLGIAAPLLLLISTILLGRGAWRITWRDGATMALIGAMLAIYQVCFFTAIRQIGVAIATLVTLCTAPVMVALIAAVFTGERLTRTVLFALAVALAGTILLIGLPGDHPGGDPLAGILYALGSAFGYAIVAVAGRRISGHAHPLQINAVAFSSGALVLLALTFPSGPTLVYPPAGWLLLLYLGLVPTALGYGIYLAGIRETSATVATTVTLIEPLTATILAWLLFGERLGGTGMIGALLLGGALLLLALRR